MKSKKRAVLYGFLIWLIPFAVAAAIFPIRTGNRALFESIMPVTLTICAVLFSVLYLRRLGEGFPREGILLGVTWLVICVVVDLLMFMWGPMKMSFADYMMDIGLTYLIIPTITIGTGLAMESRAGKSEVPE